MKVKDSPATIPTLSERVEILAVTAIANSVNIKQAGKMLGWSETMTYRTSGTPEFRKAYSTRLLAVVDGVASEAVSVHAKAIRRLGELIDSQDEKIACDASGKVLAIFSKMYDSLSRQQAEANAAIDSENLNKQITSSLLSLPTLTPSRN